MDMTRILSRAQFRGTMRLERAAQRSCLDFINHHIEEWCGDVVRRGTATNGAIHDMEDLWVGKEDAPQYGNFTPVPWSQGDVRRATRPLPTCKDT